MQIQCLSLSFIKNHVRPTSTLTTLALLRSIQTANKIQTSLKVCRRSSFPSYLCIGQYILYFQYRLGFESQQGEHLSMFTVEETDAKNAYPDIENSLEAFGSADGQQRTREANCNYEWADDIDVLNVLHSVNDWPVNSRTNCELRA